LKNNILNFLSQSYPFYYKGKTLWIVACLLFFMTLFFEYFFEPFEVYVPEHKMNHFWIAFIHASTPVNIIVLFSLFKKISKIEENWKVRKEILLVVVILLLVGISQFLIRDIIYDNANNWSWRYLYEEIRNTFLVGTLFVIILISLNFNRLNAKNKKNASAFTFSDDFLKAPTNSTVFVKTRVKSDDFNLNIDSLLFAKAAGNYAELYLKEEEIKRVLKRITIKELESILKQYQHIVKTHRSYLVNLHHVKKVSGNAQGYKLLLKNCEKKVPVARNMIKNFEERMRST